MNSETSWLFLNVPQELEPDILQSAKEMCWVFNIPFEVMFPDQVTEDAEFEIIQPKQLGHGI